MNRILKYYKNRKGITLVLMAFMLAVLLMLAGLAIDIAYMYYVKNQLQVAADASALAGAAELKGTDPIRPEARQAAWRFACRNKAAGSPVYLVTNNPTDCNASLTGVDLNNSNNPNGDMVVGDWNPSRPQTPQDLRFCAYNDTCWDATTMTINAVKARPRRTNETHGMPRVSLFIGQIFRIIGADWSAMSARASAIAVPSPLLITPSLSLCIKSCAMTGLPKLFDIQSNLDPGAENGIAWTVFSSDSSVPNNKIEDFIDGTTRLTPQDIINLCNNQCITTQNGTDGINYLGEKFRDTTFDAANKDIVSGVVTAWRVGIVITNYHCCPGSDCSSCCPSPPTCTGKTQDICTCGPDDCYQGCPPSGQGSNKEPYHIKQWARVTITQVCDNKDSTGLCSGKKGVVISALTCVDCADNPLSILSSGQARLVK